MKERKYVTSKKKFYVPSREMKRTAWVSESKIYRRALKNPFEFWESYAKELVWVRRWRKVYREKLPHFSWFVGGKLNACYNCVDRWLEEKRNKIALMWEPENPDERERKFTYYELYREVNRFASALKALGVEKGDRVSIYLPMIPETIIAMLACARIGAIHSVVFSAFSSEALKTRLIDCDAKLLITCDGYYRRGKLINLKENADEAKKGTKVERTLVIRRAFNPIKLSKEDYLYDELRENVDGYVKPKTMDSEDILFILYTSGCCKGDTLVQLGDGEIVTIKELVEKRGTEIVTGELNGLNSMCVKVKGKYCYFFPLEMCKIKTPLTEIVVTPHHPLFVLNENGEIEERLACTLEEKDVALSIFPRTEEREIALPEFKSLDKRNKNVPRIPRSLTKEFAQILGYVAGDGCVKEGVIEVTDKSIDNLRFYGKLFESVFDLKWKISVGKRKRLQIFSRSLSSYLKKHFGEICRKSRERDIPALVQKSKKEVVAGFIRGLFDAEASVQKNGIKIVSTSEILIRKLQLLLLRFKILASFHKTTAKTKFGEKKYKTPVFELRIQNKKSILSFYTHINFSDKAKRKKLETIVRGMKDKKEANMFEILYLKNLFRELTHCIKIKKKTAHRLHLDSYLYSKRGIHREHAKKVLQFVKETKELIKSFEFSDRESVKRFLFISRVSEKELADICGYSVNTVHSYLRQKNLAGTRAVERFLTAISPYLEEKRKTVLKKLESIEKRLEMICNEDVFFVPVRKVSIVKNEEKVVYDLTTPTHTYLANGILVHNTTGKPKGIVHTHGGYLVQAYATAKLVFDLHDNDVFFSTADIGWITGHTYSCYGPLLNGASVLIYEGTPDYPSPERIWQIIEKYGVTIFYTAPTLIRMMMKYGDEHVEKHKMESLRLLASVGEPIDEKSWRWFFEKVGKGRCPIIDTWWQTETGGTLINTLPGIGPFIPTYAGLSFPGTRHEVLNEEGKPCKAYEEGNLVQLPPFAPGMLRGVWKNEERYRKTYWSRYKNLYFTEDRAYKTKEGYIRITGRADDVIKVAGHRLSTAEIENAIASHRDIAEVAVVAKRDEIKGEVPVAFVVAKPGREVSESDVIKIVERKISKIARPKHVIFVDDLPHTRSGKIMRRVLKRILNKEDIGNVTTLANPESVQAIERTLKKLGMI